MRKNICKLTNVEKTNEEVVAERHPWERDACELDAKKGTDVDIYQSQSLAKAAVVTAVTSGQVDACELDAKKGEDLHTYQSKSLAKAAVVTVDPCAASGILPSRLAVTSGQVL